MNKTKIDWADMTWNPVTGCLHGCKYCYARKIANRFGGKYLPYGDNLNVIEKPFDGEKGIDPYPFKFEPTFHKYRLDEPQKTKKPQNIFVCSMADLFGEWVPDEWIKQVFEACEKAPQHRYLFLTKNPKRYRELRLNNMLPLNKNMWYGFTMSNSADTLKWYSMPYEKDTKNQFVSIEPIVCDIYNDFIKTVSKDSKMANWIIVGAETGNRKGKVIPKREWIENIVEDCRNRKVPVFMKESLKELMGDDFVQEFPWEAQKNDYT